jgi:hypothetical protein
VRISNLVYFIPVFTEEIEVNCVIREVKVRIESEYDQDPVRWKTEEARFCCWYRKCFFRSS